MFLSSKLYASSRRSSRRLKCYLSANQITSLTAPPKSVQFRNSENPLRDYRKSCSSRVLFFFSRSDFRRSRFSRRRRSFCLSGFGSCFTISSRCARHFFVSFESFWPQPLRNVFDCLLSRRSIFTFLRSEFLACARIQVSHRNGFN